VFHSSGCGRHDDLDDPVELSRAGIGAGGRWARVHVPGSRRTVFAAGRTSEYLRAGQSAVPDDHSWICDAGWEALDVVWRDGRRYAATGAGADHYQPRGLRIGYSGGGGQSAGASWGVIADDGGGYGGGWSRW